MNPNHSITGLPTPSQNNNRYSATPHSIQVSQNTAHLTNYQQLQGAPSQYRPPPNNNYYFANGQQQTFPSSMFINSQPIINFEEINAQMSRPLNTEEKIDAILSHVSQILQCQLSTSHRLDDVEKDIQEINARLDKLEKNQCSSNQQTNTQNLSEIIVSGIPLQSLKSDVQIVNAALTKIGAEPFVNDVINIRRRLQPQQTQTSAAVQAETNEVESSASEITPSENSENRSERSTTQNKTGFYTLRVKFKSAEIRDEIMRRKISHKDLLATDIFPELATVLKDRVLYLNEWLPPYTFKLLQSARVKARDANYLNPYVRQGRIFVKKDAESERIAINTEADLAKIV